MPALRLTATLVASLAPETRTEYRDMLCPGLLLRVSPGPRGARTWSLWHRTGHAGSVQRIRLGRYPAVSLADARERARAARIAIERGAAPQDAGLTVGALTDRCLAWLEPRLRPTTLRHYRQLARAEIHKYWGHREAASVGRSEVRTWAETLAERAGVQANRALALLRRVYSWAIERGLLETSPMVRLQPPTHEEASERVLSADELGAVVLALEQLIKAKTSTGKERQSRVVYRVIKLLLLTGVREAAALGGRWAEIQEGHQPTWTIPGGLRGRTKSRRPHVVPLSRQAAAVIRGQRGRDAEWIFPPERGARERAEAGPTTWENAAVRILRSRVAKILGHTPDRWTIHGLRAALATHSREALGVEPDVVAAILGHTLPGGSEATRIYLRAPLLHERREALQRWADYLDSLPKKDVPPP